MTDDRDGVDLPHRWREWPKRGRIEYITMTCTREEIVRYILRHQAIEPYVDPERELDSSARLRKDELAAVLVGLPRDPNNPYRRLDSL